MRLKTVNRYWQEAPGSRRKAVAVSTVVLLLLFSFSLLHGENWEENSVVDERRTISFRAEASGPMGEFSWYYNRTFRDGRIIEYMAMDNRTYRQVRKDGNYRAYRVFPNGSRRLYERDIKLRDFNSYVTRPYLLRDRGFDYSSIDAYRGREVFNTSYRQIEGFSYTREAGVVRDMVYVDRETGIILYSLWVRTVPGGQVREEMYLRNFSAK